MLKHLRQVLRRARLRTVRWLQDPDLDIIGLGVLATLTGRLVLYASIFAALATAGLWMPAIALTAVVGLDTVTHVEVLASLRRLMRYEVLRDVATQIRTEDIEVPA